MFNYSCTPERFGDHILDVAGLLDEIIVNPDELAKELFQMKVIYGDSLFVDYANGSLIIPMDYMGNSALERFATTLLLFKMFYRDDGEDKDANNTEYDMNSANEFIAAVLMPKKEFTRLYGILTAKELAQVFGVTESFVRFRANRLKLLKS